MLILGSFSSIRLGPLTISFGGSGGDTGSIHGMWFVPIAIAAYALIITSFAVSWKLFRYWRAITGSILAMAALTVLPFISLAARGNSDSTGQGFGHRIERRCSDIAKESHEARNHNTSDVLPQMRLRKPTIGENLRLLRTAFETGIVTLLDNPSMGAQEQGLPNWPSRTG